MQPSGTQDASHSLRAALHWQHAKPSQDISVLCRRCLLTVVSDVQHSKPAECVQFLFCLRALMPHEQEDLPNKDFQIVFLVFTRMLETWKEVLALIDCVPSPPESLLVVV